MGAVFLAERLTFDQLFRISDPKRVYRSFTVRGPPLEIDSYQDAVYYIYNFKSNPSTTGFRWRGYVKFFKPKNKNPKNVPLQHLECLVDCGCPDFRYKWAWANKQRQSSVVGPNSLNQAWNKAPRKTNPHGRPGLCKHILAARAYIYGLISSFEGNEPDTADKLDKLTRLATRRWTDFYGQMRAAKAREQEIRRRREQRNLGQLPTVPPPAPPEPVRTEPQPPSTSAVTSEPKEEQPKATTDLKSVRPEPLPLAVPPGQRGRTLPTSTSAALPSPPGTRGRNLPSYTITKPKRVIGNRVVKPLESWIRTQDQHLILENVVTVNRESMKSIQEAQKLVREMIDDETDHLGAEAMPPADLDGASDIGGDTLEPSEPPVSDSAVGADTEGQTALSLLQSIDTSLQQIAAAVAPPQEMPGEEMPGEEMPPGGPEGAAGGELPMPDEPPADEEISAEAAAEGEPEEVEAAEHETEEEEEKPPKKEDEE